MRGFAGRTWAVAKVTLLEAARRQVFLLLLIFAASLLIPVALFPSLDSERGLRTAELWALRSAALFTAIAALFLAAFSLPSDFDEKRIYMLASKPVSKSTLYLGKFVGFVLMLLIFVGGMGIITVGFLRTVQLFGSEDFPPLAAYPRVAARDFSGQGAERAEPGENQEEKRRLRGPDPRAQLVWRFQNLDRSDFSETARAVLRFNISGSGDEFRSSGNVFVTLGSADGGDSETKQIFMNTNRDHELDFPSSLIGDDGTLLMIVKRGDRDGVIVGTRDSVVLHQKSDLFEFNFLKGMGLIFLQSLLVLAVTMTASTALSAPISIILGIMLYIAGNAYSFVADGVRTIDRGLDRFEKKETKKTPENIPPLILQFSSAVSRGVLSVVPDFDQFDFSHWLLRDRAVSWSDLARAGLRSAPHALVVVVLGMILMLFKSFG